MNDRQLGLTRFAFPSLAAAPLVLATLATAGNARAQGLEPPPPLTAPQPAPTVVRPLPSTPVLPPSPPPAGAPSEEAEDSGLGLEWVWFNADIGGAYANMQSLSATNLALQRTESGGPVFGAAAGIRLVFLTLGVRVRDMALSSIGNLWEFSGEVKFHTRIWRIDPYFGVRGGYNFVGSLSSDSVQVATGSNPSDVSVHGFDVGPVVGIDGYISKFVSIGVDVDAQLLFLQRPPLPLPPGVTPADLALLTPQQQQLYNNSGSSVGLAVTPTAHLGIHF